MIYRYEAKNILIDEDDIFVVDFVKSSVTMGKQICDRVEYGVTFLLEENDEKARELLKEYYKKYFIVLNDDYFGTLEEHLNSDIKGAIIGDVYETIDTSSNIVDLAFDEGTLKYFTNTRRPYYQMRGKPITKEQAMEVISRTDNYFRWNDEYMPENFIYSTNFDSWWFDMNHIPSNYGWVHPNGNIGSNAITQKYPTLAEYVDEWCWYLKEFPFLDLIIAITDYNEYPPDDAKFEDCVTLGIWVHDNKVEFLSPKNALKQYKAYARKYENNPRSYIPEHCLEYQNIDIIDYKNKCLEMIKQNKV